MTPASQWFDEMFCADDGGDGPFWLIADGRSLSEAVVAVEGIVGPLERCSVDLVSGRIEDTPNGPRVHIDRDGDGHLGLWEVDPS